MSTLPPLGRLHPLAISLVALGLSLAAWTPALRAYPRTQLGDGPPYQKTLEAALAALRHGELPLWNAYECGGLPLWDNPQSPIGAPLAWPALLIGTTAAMLVWYVAHTALGFLSMWLFARRELALGDAGAATASVTWALAGVHAQHLGGGHFTFAGFLYVPLALTLWRRAELDRREAIALGGLLALLVYEGAVYPLAHLSLLLPAEALTRARPARLLNIARAGVVAVAVAVGLSAARLLPVAMQLASHARQLPPEHDPLTVRTVMDMFLARTHERQVVAQSYVWPEYGAFLGPIVLSVAVLGIALGGVTHAWLLALTALFFVLMLGGAPYALLKAHVFPFREMRVPARFVYEVSLGLAAFAGVGIERVPAAGGTRGRILVLVLVGAGDLAVTGLGTLRGAFAGPPLAEVVPSERLYFGGGDLAPNMADQPRQNRGRRACWDEWGWGADAPLWDGDVPQVRGKGVVIASSSRTTRRFVLEVDAPAPARVQLNAAYDRGWHASVGQTANDGAALVLDVPAGRHHVEVVYRPALLLPGALLSLATLLTVVTWVARGAPLRRFRVDARRPLPPVAPTLAEGRSGANIAH